MRRGAPLVAALALQACAGPERPAPPDAAIAVLATWRAGAPVSAQPVISATWWRVFQDPALDALVERALAANLDLRIVASRVEEARAQFRSAVTQARPSASLRLDGGTSRSVSPFGLGVDQERGQVGVAAAYEVDLFGRLRQSRLAARDDLLATAPGT